MELLGQVHLTYTVLMIASIFTCSLLLRRSQAHLPLSTTEKIGIGVGAFCGAMIGAKLPFVLSDWNGLLSGTAWFAHGKTILCGIVGGYLGVELAKWTLDVRVRTGDTFAVPVAISVAIGRVACFVGGCCYGKPTTLPWGVVFPQATGDSAMPRHPTQLYEAAFHFVMAGMLILLQRTGRFRAHLIKLYILAYVGYRFATEFIRPEPTILGPFTGYQLAAVAIAAMILFLWRRDAARIRKDTGQKDVELQATHVD